jgi:hypothetical protein
LGAAVGDGETVSLTGKQMLGGLYLFAVVVLILVVVGSALRPGKPSPDEALEAAVAAASPQPGASALTDRQRRAMEALFGGGQVFTHDANALNKSVGEPVVLRTGKTVWRVTPATITAGFRACAAGPLLAVELLVEVESGSETLPLNAFHLVTADGTDVAVVPACSTGTAEQRTLVFAGSEADRLIVGRDPSDPEVVWHLS